jgi:hypothetical protein
MYWTESKYLLDLAERPLGEYPLSALGLLAQAYQNSGREADAERNRTAALADVAGLLQEARSTLISAER